MASTPKRPAADPDDDPVYDLDRAKVLYRLFGGRRVVLPWQPMRWLPDRTEIARASSAAVRVEVSDRARNLALWDRTCPMVPHHRPVDDVMAALIRKQWISVEAPWYDVPFHAVRMAIATAAEQATHHWRAHVEARNLKAFADALQVVGDTLADPHGAEVAAGHLAVEFGRLPPRHFQAVGTHDLQARTVALEADFAAVIMALRPARPALDRIAARAGEVMEQVWPSKRIADPWKRVFAAELTRTWRLMVKPDHGQPSSSEASMHQQFIVAAYRSLGGAQSKSFASSVRGLIESGELEPEPLLGDRTEADPAKITFP